MDTLLRDEWLHLEKRLSPDEARRLAYRRWLSRLYRAIRELVLLPISLPRGFFHLVSLLRELERLHYKPMRGVTRGSGCVVDRQTWLVNGNRIQLGRNVKISAFSSVMAGYIAKITIGDNTIIGPGATIVSFNHGFRDRNAPIRFQAWDDTEAHSIHIGENVWIGARAIILPGSCIGDGSIIGAGAVVRGYVGKNSVVTTRFETRLRDKS